MILPIRNSRIRLSQGQVFWREVGDGPTLVFLHGSWQDGDQWLPVIEQLSANYHCIALDLLGFGESERPAVHYSIALEVECLAEYLEALKLRQIYLVGHSLGAWVAASYALKYPEQVSRLVLLAPEGVEARSQRNRWQGAKLILLPGVYWGVRSLQPLARLLKLGGIDRLLERRKTLLQFPIACKLLFKRRWAEIKAELVQEKLATLKLPILILHGELDTSDAATLSRMYTRIVPQAQFCQLGQAGTDLPQTQPDQVAQQIREFVLNLNKYGSDCGN